MAGAPTFRQASAGETDATGAFTFTGTASGAQGDIVILQIVVDGTGAISWGSLTSSNINDLSGAAGWTEIGIFNAGVLPQQRLFIGRRTSLSSAPTFSASANTSGDDVYGRFYEFTNVSAGTALAEVIEGGPVSGLRTDDSNVELLYGSSGTFEYQAFSFVNTNAATLSRVTLGVSKAGGPSDGIFIELQADSAGSPSGSALATSDTLAGSSITAGSATNYPFAISASLSASTTYWIVAKRSGARDTSNHYYIVQSNPLTSPITTVAKASNTGVWSTNTNDISFAIGAAGGTGTQAATSASVTDAGVSTLGPDRLALNFVGLADDAMGLAAFAGETNGDWATAGTIYETATGTDATVWLNASYLGDGPYTLVATSGSSTAWGATAANTAIAQSFVAPTTTAAVTVNVGLGAGAPSDDVTVTIETDSAGVPSGSVVTTCGSISGSALNLNYRTSVTFPVTVTLTASTTYWIVIRRGGAVDINNNYVVGLGTSYASGAGATYNGSTWTGGGNDLSFTVLTSTSYPSGLTIDGGSDAITSIGWSVVGFALIGTTVVASSRVLTQGFTDFNDPGIV